MRLSRIALVTLALIVTCVSHAADTRIDSVWYHFPGVTVSVHKHEANPFETAIPVQVIGTTRINNMGVTSLEEMVQGQPGLTTATMGPWSQKFVLRGLSGSHVLTLIDGLRFNVLRAYGNHAPLIDVDQIERIEIVRGPASFLYGSDAIAGVINIITKSPIRREDYSRFLKTTAGFQYASVNKQFSEQAGIQGQWNKWTMLLHINHRKADLLNTPKGELANSAFESIGLNTKVSFSPANGHRLLLTSQISKMSDVGVPTNPFATSAKFIHYDENRAILMYEWKPEETHFQRMQMQAYFQDGDREFDARLYHVPNGPLCVNNHLNANRKVQTMGSTCHTNISFWQNTLTTIGVDGFYTSDDTRRIADPVVVTANDEVKKDPPADLTPPTPPSWRMGMGVFAEHEIQFSNLFDVTAGIRFDQLKSHADAAEGTLVEFALDKTDRDISGSLGLLYRLSETVHVTANVGRAFKAPTLQQRFFKGTAQIGFLTGNPDLKSETSRNVDIGCKWQTQKLSGEISLFHNEIDNFIVMNPVDVETGSYEYANVGHARLLGAEFSTDWRIHSAWTSFFTASLVRGKDTQAEMDLPQIPADQATLGVRFYPSNFWVELKGRAVAKQDRAAENELTTPAYGLCDIGLGYRFKELGMCPGNIRLSLNVRNLFNTRYRDHLSSVTWWDAAGRNIILTINTDF